MSDVDVVIMACVRTAMWRGGGGQEDGCAPCLKPLSTPLCNTGTCVRLPNATVTSALNSPFRKSHVRQIFAKLSGTWQLRGLRCYYWVYMPIQYLFEEGTGVGVAPPPHVWKKILRTPMNELMQSSTH